ncbi:MAG TPA: FkbM family methyltransferase [Pyrinomonadaceae bacterium]|nr:FkbM family methyltransferase [Pyrinomonadaceae bacterium]
MSSEIASENHRVAEALSAAGRDEELRSAIFDALRAAEDRAENPALFREQVRWPLILSLLSGDKTHRVTLENGVIFDVRPDSRIEKALLLSSLAHPDHVWEPQTTRLLLALAATASNVIVGGAYIGDHVVLLARAMADAGRGGVVHAFEPLKSSFERLLHHLEINGLSNVVAQQMGLWDKSDVQLRLEGHLGLASSVPVNDSDVPNEERIQSVSIDDYARAHELAAVDLIMLDTEGGEENALRGARDTIAKNSPNIVFEIHRNFVDWSNGLAQTSIARFLTSQGYDVFAIRDFHGNYPMSGYAIEIVPISQVYLEGPPHGFNVLATKDPDLVNRLDLRIVENVSPKLLLDKDPALHAPLSRR